MAHCGDGVTHGGESVAQCECVMTYRGSGMAHHGVAWLIVEMAWLIVDMARLIVDAAWLRVDGAWLIVKILC